MKVNKKNFLNILSVVSIGFAMGNLEIASYFYNYWIIASSVLAVSAAALMLCYLNLEGFSDSINSIILSIVLATCGGLLFTYKWFINKDLYYLVLTVLFLVIDLIIIKHYICRLKLQKKS